MTSPVSKNQKKKSLSPVKSKAIATALATLPTLLSAEELQEIDALTVSSTAKIQQVDQQTNSEVQQMNLTAQSINKERSALQDQIISTSGTLTPAASSVDIKPKAEKIPVSVNCENGMYFDATTGTIVYQKDVVVTHPQYHLSCSKELKVLLKEKPGTEKPATAESKTDETLIPNASADKKFSGLSKAIATGNVLIKSKDKNGKLIIARSQTATYDADTGVIILRGGNPTVQQGDTIARILSDKGYIKILQNRSVRIEGRHEIKANLNELQDK